MSSSVAIRHGMQSRCLATAVTVATLSACHLYTCETDARSAEYAGRLGAAVAPAGDIPSSESGRIFVGAGHAYFEVHTPSGEGIAGGLRQQSISPFSPACT